MLIFTTLHIDPLSCWFTLSNDTGRTIPTILSNIHTNAQLEKNENSYKRGHPIHYYNFLFISGATHQGIFNVIGSTAAP
jgi:hypothetical protein